MDTSGLYPSPKNASLDLIRVEMLNLGAKYAWLDVLCLRQEGGKSDHLRLDEWKLDVPTIGWVYATQATYADRQPIRVVCYFNGLGSATDLTLDDFKSDRCWFRRAWTLQEITPNPIIGGETGNDVMDKEVRRRFDEKLTSLREIRKLDMALEILSEMQNRVSTKPLDRVAGLVYLVMTDSIPIYDAEQSESDAWEVLVDVMNPRTRAELLFYYPEPGNGKKSWRPSWQQVMMDKDIGPCSSRASPLSGKVYRTEDLDADWYPDYHIKLGDVRGLAEARKEEMHREGELVIKVSNRAQCTLKIVADHAYLIPDGSYTLIGCDVKSSNDAWVVGRRRESDGKFDKLSVFRSADDEEVKLSKLPLGKKIKTYLC